MSKLLNAIGPELHPRLILVNLLLCWLPRGVGGRVRTLVYRHLLRLDVGHGTVFLEAISIRGKGDVYGRIRIGRNCGLRDCTFVANAPISIGDGVRISADTLITTDTYSIGPSAQRRGEHVLLPVTIGDGCWITQGATIHAGASIGPGTIVANRGSVVGELPADRLVGGVPARSLRALG
jgi:acetyltransferase-like isoleucine patch superfamily enzyme